MGQQYTFLFTDIEGSTRLWEQHPQAMSRLLTDHNRILQQSIESQQGTVFKTVGDGFCAVFDSPLDALSAAITAQQTLQGQPPSESTDLISIKVRMGLHTGPAEYRNGDYFGPTLNRVARLMASASGGQTLISAATFQAAAGQLPGEVELRDLGRHRLRDLKDDEHIYQIVVPGLVNQFPPLKTLSPRPTNLPAQLTSFVGRDEDVREICRQLRLPRVRLQTLLGTGGIGKTRLSIQIGTNLLDEYEDGVFFVALAPVTRPEAVIEVIAQTLKVEETGTANIHEAVKTHLQNRQLLLVLDNFEQVIDAAPLVNELLAAAPRLKVLTTSREELLIYGEQLYRVAPLSVPESAIVEPHTLAGFSAVALFTERVRAMQPDFTLDAANAAAVAEICRRLDGLPLAIELAAVRTRELSVQDIADQLSNRLQVLTKGPRDFPSRQRTIRGAIEWSYDLLPAAEQQTFARLAVFAGAFTADAADAIAGAETLNRLTEKSLVQQSVQDESHITFNLLETLREYALEQLTARDELDSMQQRHAAYYVRLTETAESNLTGEYQTEWFTRLEIEQSNIQAALEWLVKQKDYLEAGRMVGVLWRFWSAHSRLSIGAYWIGQTLSHSAALPPLIHAKALHGMGRLQFLQYRYTEAEAVLKTSLPLYEQADDQQGQAAVYLSLGEIALRQTAILPAEGYFQHALALYVALDDQAGFARCLGQLGRLAVREGNLAGAESLFQQSLELIRRYGSTESIALVINDLAEVLRTQKNYDQAAALYHESLALYRQLHFDVSEAVILHNLGQVARQQTNYPESLGYFRQALSLLQNLEEMQIIAECLAGFGSVLVDMGAVERAVHFLAASKAIMDSVSIQLDAVDQIEYDHTLAKARRQLTDSQWADAWAAGRGTSPESIITEALQHH